ncbi:DUF3656 domain-containing protein [Eubacteriaceae bacterium ES3]|nr:DUF3656 domain-containing protein [Eubacteriaceae bacterium ES3]
MKKKPELLAPAGNMESVIAAINGGADAIYLGGKKFNARQNAGNLSDEQLTEVVHLVKSLGKKIYIVLNTLIKDSEWEIVTEVVSFYNALQIDGLIVQDLGLIDWIQEAYPQLELQTSTQVSIYGLEGVRFFENLGIKRVVLPREMPISEVKQIKDESTVELKIFVHGSLCYAYSGQCLISSQIGGRSGNRGLCAQPCRKIYRLLDEQGQELNKGYLLSPKDLSTLNSLESIVASGVDALKIEGRMKTPEYVYAVTRAYRNRLDQIENGEKGDIDDQEVMQVFNRDFTGGHLIGDSQILNPLVAKNRGIRIGVVGKVKTKKQAKGYYNLPLELDPQIVLSIGDGLSFGESGEKGSRVDRIFLPTGESLEKNTGYQDVLIPVKGEFDEGMPVYRNFDADLMKRLKKEALAEIKISDQEIIMSIRILADKLPVIEISDGIKSLIYTGCEIPQKAQKNPLTEELIKNQMSRLGGTGLKLSDCHVVCENGLFLSKSQLNNLRNESVLAYKQSKEGMERSGKTENINQVERPNVKNNFVPEIISLQFEVLPDDDYLDELLDENKSYQGVLELVLPLNLDQAEQFVLEKTARLRSKGYKVFFSLPQVINQSQSQKLIKYRDLDKIKDFCDGLIVANFESLQILKDRGLNLQTDVSFNVFNSKTAWALKKWGVSELALSLELSKEEIIGLKSPLPLVLNVYGQQKLMVSRKCPFSCKVCSSDCKKIKLGTLSDERGFTFPVRRDRQGLIHIYNGDCLFLEHEIQELSGIKTWRIRVLDEDVQTVREIIDYYNGILENQSGREPGLTKKVTRGSFKRGVK